MNTMGNHSTNTTAAELADLADRLGVREASLHALDVARNGNGWLIPERDETGAITGQSRRFLDGRKGFVRGGRRGLTLAWPMPPECGTDEAEPVLIVEGMSDAAVGLDLGYYTIGRPGADTSAAALRSLVALMRGRHVAIIGENDVSGAGRRGAEKTALALLPTAASVKILFPPEGTKDLRAWYCAPDGIDRPALSAAIAARAPLEAPAPAADHDTEAESGLVPLGTPDPETGRVVLSPRRTLPTAEAFVREFHQHTDGRTLVNYAGMFMAWRGNRWAEIEGESLTSTLQPWLHRALRYVTDRRTGQPALAPFESNPSTIRAALDSIRACVHLPATHTPPCWLDNRPNAPEPRNLLPFPTGALDLATGKVLPPTPALFTTAALDFDYVPNPPAPARWLSFLSQLWGDDTESLALLQEFMGYCLIGDTSQQKALLIVGPKRSGKGTIGRVLTRLVGAGNVCGPTTSSLAGPFGLQPLIGKSLAIVSDARFTGDSVGVVVERLLCISGEDSLTVDRKFMGSITMKLPTRLIFLSNELPRLHDSSGALAGRFMILRLTRSFYGHEDTTLTSKLSEELPGILTWAIEGLKRLRARGRFTQPASVAAAVQEMEDLSSPVGAFVRDCCEVGAGKRAWTDDMFAAWRRWCEADGRNTTTSRQTFGRDLSAAVPGVVCRRHRQQGRFYDGICLAGTTP